ncbi:50S ribosomal protein L1 [Candidatus Uhrbacteria bacterium CG_4_9_14_0_2_um_filter_41_50]|uniref:Large ribosomal subunit protein uL1 n=1 Tax=Candidatus Uhrbacteria bacterium CG_4_9_14_0_2_um_filter_41_50 TaxID=1975031 RepID=A0A2M8ENP3_9BACT|nr:MAG: 50S ribosomal protein L1 [Candidatus Uhrbacteria bacterium CG_4_10_14_3_um_filter_41_21]PIZ54233.1 MAG: 50S ribosomal protein L1 [Candidatus Uhrbacteria bacterium CG_4_10_14_0_2_um_filter_41_21]PJB84403.1 MAG: 50S ribosomal protein L1 [Candidatus Uhrbacteria bacterium CG_4_9_14_0_8_um_filter_41_16]PJC24363.1 MAG: 50S ribosomal protein L1 [Candidatus Uhrbacteria bacterium CG_4_9_14_0_2_um_filter_41_50]PJE75274.1 MAG: 50S ribosomal protein L1 [Candidatus Uhrbacteria bacterium CG10_big_fil
MTNKRFKEAQAKIEKDKLYSLEEAVKLAKTNATAKFDESIEIHMSLGIDPKQSDQQIRPTVILPHGTGKKVRIVAFVDSANEKIAKDAGADIVGTEEYIEKLVQTGVIEFDIAVAVPGMMPKLAKAARILGPRGLMPNPKTDTVGTNVVKMIEEQKGGKVSFKNDNTSNIHMSIARASFEEGKILENAQVAIAAIKKAKPASSKGIYIKSAFMTSTMGPAVKLDTATL